MSHKTYELVLEYLKVLAWPLVVILLLMLFHEDIKGIVSNISSIKAGPVSLTTQNSGTKKGSKADSLKLSSHEIAKTTKAPDLWFNMRRLRVSHSECLETAKSTLNHHNFIDGGINHGATAYGYNGQYVGTFWCIEKMRTVYVAVAGPSSEEAEGYMLELDNTFVLVTGSS